MMYRVECLRSVSTLFGSPEEWNSLSGGVPFRQTSWLQPWWDQFGGQLEAYVLVARDAEEQICGILPLCRSFDSPRTLRFIGDNNACTDFASILLDPQDANAESIVDAMVQFLCEHTATDSEGWDFLELDGVSAGDPVMRCFSASLAKAGVIVHAQSRMSTWLLQAAESWEQQLSRHSKRTRKKTRGFLESVDKTPGMERVIANSTEQVDEFMDAIIELHQRRWNAVGEPGTYADKQLRDFVTQMAHEMFRNDRLYLPVLRLDGRIIGGELGILSDDLLYIYSSGFDLDAANLEPGRILAVNTLKYVHDQGLRGIEYMRGDEPYKARSGAEPTPLLQLRVVAPRWWAKVCHSAWSAQFELKQWARRRTGRELVKVVDMALTS
ncbi:cellulose biosynthesis protein celD [Rhodopirellula maiorica SM1]|uniref:Cellulose biosynthesis protein celD n=1 Tax=Rhodopirellula maiorica SM1 TaxID=1265738 RepID=M5RLH5_9BACT|nr:GNAT family N-acetyltransferase [Rhodopirellula maiorica]EMI20183.1 cellulose biosynthesis protein celD [Rhodopirellula maiorica SM1]